MSIKNYIKINLIATRERLGSYSPPFLRRRLPPVRGRVVSVAGWAAGKSDPAGEGATLHHWEEVPPRTRAVPPGYPGRWEPFLAESPRPGTALFVASVRGARVHGQFPCVLTAPGDVVEELSRVHGEPIGSHPVYSFTVLPKPRRLSGRTLLLASAYADNFYHWFVDALPRLDLLRRAGIDAARIDHVLAPDLSTPFFAESLLAFPPLVGKIVPLSNETQWACDELICPSLPHRVGDADAWGPEFVRRQVLGRGRAASGSRRLYVSRAAAGRRRLANERRLYDEVLVPRGFEFVQLEHLPLRRQAELFAAAGTIVAPHGAGLTNLIYAPQACRVVELLSEDYPALCYWHLADELGLNYRYVVGKTEGGAAPGAGQYRDFAVDPAHVMALLDAGSPDRAAGPG